MQHEKGGFFGCTNVRGPKVLGLLWMNEPLTMDHWDLEAHLAKARKKLLDRPLGTVKSATPAQLAAALEEVLLVHDHERAREILSLAHRLHPLETVLLEVVAPVLVDIGTAWEKGYITVAMEHAATSLLRHHVIRLFRSDANEGPMVVCTTVPGEQHEGGALLASVLLERSGYRVDYLGADTPLDDLRRHVERVQPDAVLLSITTPAPLVDLPVGVFHAFPAPVIAGGSGAKESLRPIEASGARYLGEDLDDVAYLIRLELQDGIRHR